MSYSIYTNSNVESFDDIFGGYVDLSNNISGYKSKVATDNVTNQTQSEIIKKRINPKPTTIDGRIEDEKAQIEKTKYIYLAGTITLISLIILMKSL